MLAQLRKVDGFLLTRTESDYPRVRFLQEKDLPFVTHGRIGGVNSHPWFDVDGEAAMADAVERLANLGHRRIGMAASPDCLNFARLRLQGFYRGLQTSGLGRQAASIETVESIGIAAGRAAVLKLLQQPRPPTALVCMNDVFAFGAYAAARDLGLRIGSDLSVIGYDGLPAGDFLDPPLTTYDQSSVNAGAVVADMLLDLIDGLELDHPNQLERATLRARGSHGPPSVNSEALAGMIERHAAKMTMNDTQEGGLL
jgi:LacI family transcriptional regulator